MVVEEKEEVVVEEKEEEVVEEKEEEKEEEKPKKRDTERGVGPSSSAPGTSNAQVFVLSFSSNSFFRPQLCPASPGGFVSGSRHPGPRGDHSTSARVPR